MYSSDQKGASPQSESIQNNCKALKKLSQTKKEERNCVSSQFHHKSLAIKAFVEAFQKIRPYLGYDKDILRQIPTAATVLAFFCQDGVDFASYSFSRKLRDAKFTHRQDVALRIVFRQ